MRSRAGAKPLDLGTGVVCGSFAEDGSWLSLATTHPTHGFVELSAVPPFDEADRGHPDRVRRYRALMADPSCSFLRVETESAERLITCRATGYRRTVRHSANHEGWTASGVAHAVDGARSLAQSVTIRRTERGSGLSLVKLRFRGRLDRPALAEITEVDPPLPTGATTTLVADGPRLRIRARELPAAATVDVTAAEQHAQWRVRGGEAEVVIPWPEQDAELAVNIVVELWVLDNEGARPRRRRSVSSGAGRTRAFDRRPVPAGRLVVPPALRRDVERIRRRALDYALGCTALRVADDRAAILTDHRILPLSWTRDAYFQALLLLDEAARTGAWRLVDMVADHLRWLWLSCDRPDGTWARSHHADGRRKDEVFQADQQLYPLLELADYWRVTGALPELPAAESMTGGWRALVAGVLDGLYATLSAGSLVPTEENAADDTVAQPYLLANQILAWHCLQRLQELQSVVGLEPSPAGVAAVIRRRVEELFPSVGPNGRLWAYAVDGRGQRLLYHDANDIPTAMAPLWGFCSADDPLWLETMRFAFGRDNAAYVEGPLGGLGSRHTAGTWSLGLVQEWVAMSLAGERTAAADALERLVAIAFADGSLPEASDPLTGRAVARHWFAWPAAFLGALLPADQYEPNSPTTS